MSGGVSWLGGLVASFRDELRQVRVWYGPLVAYGVSETWIARWWGRVERAVGSGP